MRGGTAAWIDETSGRLRINIRMDVTKARVAPSQLVRPGRFERPAFCSGGKCRRGLRVSAPRPGIPCSIADFTVALC